MADGSISGDVAVSGEEEFFAEADAETVEIIKDLIETRVRPAVAPPGNSPTFFRSRSTTMRCAT
eukprot:gene45070-61051_t